jgi:hypothetical protein
MGTRLKLIIAAAGVIFVGGIIGAFVAMQQSPIHLADTVRKQVNFAIILPKKLPGQFYVAAQPTFDTDKRILTTKLQNTLGQDVIISQQSKPKDIDLKQVDAQETFLTGVGSVYVLKGEAGRIQAIIDASDSWVLINGNKDINVKTVKAIIDSLGAQ